MNKLALVLPSEHYTQFVHLKNPNRHFILCPHPFYW